jgi:hypothetical protein
MVVCRPRRPGCDAEAVRARAEPSVTPRLAVAAFTRRSGRWHGQQPNERCCRGPARARRRDGSDDRASARERGLPLHGRRPNRLAYPFPTAIRHRAAPWALSWGLPAAWAKLEILCLR